MSDDAKLQDRGEEQGRRRRIEELKTEARRLYGGDFPFFEAEEAPEEVLEAFWTRVVEGMRVQEKGLRKDRETTLFQQLLEEGVELPAPQTLDEEDAGRVLEVVFPALARRRVYLQNTDHLSNQELYSKLWNETLRSKLCEDEAIGADWILDLLGGWSEEDVLTYLRFYADDFERACWAEKWPDMEIPEHQSPPYDRDRRLPSAF